MKRYVVPSFLLAAILFSAVGCRRVDPERKQPAVEIRDEDKIKPPTIEDSAKAFIKKKRN